MEGKQFQFVCHPINYMHTKNKVRLVRLLAKLKYLKIKCILIKYLNDFKCATASKFIF